MDASHVLVLSVSIKDIEVLGLCHTGTLTLKGLHVRLAGLLYMNSERPPDLLPIIIDLPNNRDDKILSRCPHSN